MDTNERLEPDTGTEEIGGFGRFLVAVASFLTVATIRQLANVFNYPPARIDEFENDRNPGYVFVMSLRDRGIILPNDVSVLIDALRDIDLHGIAYELTTAFEKHCKQKKTIGLPRKEGERRHRFSTDVLIESFRRNLSVDQSPGASLINSMKINYRRLYDKVQPIPFIRDKQLCVDNVFIDSGVERLVRGGVNRVWQKLESYHCLFNDLPPAPTRCILFGEPGFGKSIFALQLVYDWCNSCLNSPLKEVDILIFFRLRQLIDVSSIFKAIKQFILPHDSPLSESDITDIIYSSKSVVILLDGFDEYANKRDEDDIITKVMNGLMFQRFPVIVTTRPSMKPLEMPATTVKLRLTGFDSEAQDYYLRKNVPGSHSKAIKKIKSYIEENYILRDLCENPLFFAMFSHMFFEKEMSMKFESATSFFRYMIGSFHEHMKNKLKGNELKKYEQLEQDLRKLDKVSFEALTGEKQEIVWMKNQLQKLIGRELHDQYIAVGILVEEESVVFNDGPGSHTSSLAISRIQTRFYHKLFCEWYAAHHISELARKALTFTLNRTLRKIDPFELPYVLRFACGISPADSSRIIKYLQTLEGGDKFAILCILEQTGQVDDILDSIQQLCFEGIVISGHDSLLLQRSSFQLLEIAAKHNIPITAVYLYNCFQSVGISTPSTKTISGLAFTSRILVKKLRVEMYSRNMTEDEVMDILQFASMCPSLRLLRFGGSVPPQSFKVDSVLSTLKSRNVEVTWRMFKDYPLYILNLETGRWEQEDDEEEPTTHEFEKMRIKFAEHLEVVGLWDPENETEDQFRRDIEIIRRKLRKNAERRLEKDPK